MLSAIIKDVPRVGSIDPPTYYLRASNKGVSIDTEWSVPFLPHRRI